MTKLSISKAWDETRAILGRDGRHIATVAAALVLLPTALATTIAPTNPEVTGEPKAMLFGLIANLLSLVGTLSITAIALKPGVTVGESIAVGARRLPVVLGAMLMFFLPMAVLLAIIIAPNASGDTPQAMIESLSNAGAAVNLIVLLWAIALLYLFIRFMFVSPVAIADNAGPVALLKRSWALSRGNVLRLLGFLVMLIILLLVLSAVAGVMGGIVAALVAGPPEPMSVSALVVGLMAGLATMVVVILSALMAARLYVQGAEAAETPSPSA